MRFSSLNTRFVAGVSRRFTYPVRAKLAQYLIIFLLSSFSSSVAPSEEDNHKTRLAQWMPDAQDVSPFDDSLTSLFRLDPHQPPKPFYLCCICRYWGSRPGSRLPHGGVQTHAFLVYLMFSQAFPRGGKFLRARGVASLSLCLSLNWLLYLLIWKNNTCSKYKIQNTERASHGDPFPSHFFSPRLPASEATIATSFSSALWRLLDVYKSLCDHVFTDIVA